MGNVIQDLKCTETLYIKLNCSLEKICASNRLPDIFYHIRGLQRQMEVITLLNYPLCMEHCTDISQVTKYGVIEHRIYFSLDAVVESFGWGGGQKT